MKRVLIITYYWPPAGGSGVQRWLKFVKYLREFGYEPVVYTPESPEFMAIDETLEKEIPQGVEVVKREIFEPYSIYKILTGKRGKALKPGFINTGGSGAKAVPFKEKLSLFIRSNMFIPDPKTFWICPSARFLKKYLKENPVEAIISTGPPHSMHLIAKKVSRATGIPWIADFRDPWTKMYTFKYMRYSAPVIAIHKILEKSVVESADAIVTVTGTIGRELRALRKNESKGAEAATDMGVHIITNGFDNADFSTENVPLENSFTLTYTGLFVRTQNPAELWKVLAERVRNNSVFATDLKIRLIGHTDGAILEDIEGNGLGRNLEIMDYMPHTEVIKWQRDAQILLLSGGMEPESKGILTGKFFEYLAARRPILGFGPKGGDMDIALEECEAGKMFDYDNKADIAEWIDRRYEEYKGTGIPPVSGKIEKYSRRELTARLAGVLNEITERKI